MANWKEPKNDYTPENQVVPEIFNTLAENERYLQERKITIEQVQDATINSAVSENREDFGDEDTVKGFFGKIRKWISDLKALAFKGTIGMADIDDFAVNATKIDTNAVETSKIKDGAVIDSKIDSVSASKVTGLHKVATSGSCNDLKDKLEMSSGDSPKVVFEGECKYYETRLNFTIKGGYRYAVELENGIGQGVATFGDKWSEPSLRVAVPGYCYGTDSVMHLYIICLNSYDGIASYDGGGEIYIEGNLEVYKGIVDKEGYMRFNGEACPVIKRIIELGKTI